MPKYARKHVPILTALRESAALREIPLQKVLAQVQEVAGEGATRKALDVLKTAFVADGMERAPSLPTLAKTTELVVAVGRSSSPWAIDMGVSALSTMASEGPSVFSQRVGRCYDDYKQLCVARGLGGDQLFQRVRDSVERQMRSTQRL